MYIYNHILLNFINLSVKLILKTYFIYFKLMPHTCQKCFRTFHRKHNYDKHSEICIFNIQNENDIKSDLENSVNLPSYKELYNFVLNLSVKINKLEKENESFKNIINNKLLKMNSVNWLNKNKNVLIEFDEWFNTFNVSEYLHIVFETDLINGISLLIENNYKNTNNPPLFSFDNKNKQLFVYNNLSWKQLNQTDFDNFIDILSNKFIVAWSKYLMENQYLITEPKYIDNFTTYQTKVYGPSNNNDSRNSKIKQNIYNKIKCSVSNVQIT